jgi:hypothetical protein
MKVLRAQRSPSGRKREARAARPSAAERRRVGRGRPRPGTRSRDLDFHNAPRRQYVINLDAAVELMTRDGTRRIVPPGGILLAEDTTGRGHRSRAVSRAPRRSLFVTLD